MFMNIYYIPYLHLLWTLLNLVHYLLADNDTFLPCLHQLDQTPLRQSFNYHLQQNRKESQRIVTVEYDEKVTDLRIHLDFITSK